MEATNMKPVRFIGAGVLLLLLGAVASTYAQQDQQEKDAKAPIQEQQAKPEKQQEQAKGQQGQQHQQQQQDQNKQQQQARQQQQQDQNNQRLAQQHQQVAMRTPQEQHAQAHEQQAVWQEHRAHDWQSEHRDWQQRGGYNGERIPDDRYRGYFGPDHTFRIYSSPVVVVGGSPRFQYSGFYFNVIDPWPEYWSDNWYEDDDVYVDYSGDGYYLYNRRYPRDRIAISVSVDGSRNGEWGGVWQEHRAHHWQSEHRNWHQRGGYNGYQIPEDSYRSYFGPDHSFRMSSYPVTTVGGYPRFQYGGFSFSVVDPWPEYWSNNWYENDDVYIDNSGDGYYMYDRRYPRDRIAINVYAN
jgi:hypothetical protein